MKMVTFRKFLVVSLALTLSLFSLTGTSLAKDKAYTTKDLNEQLVLATVWMQASAEFRALCYQAFNLGRMNLDNFIANYKGKKPIAIIVDADETVITTLTDEGDAASVG